MGNEAAVQQSAKGLTFVVPAYLTARIKAGGLSNIDPRNTVNSLTFGTKAWVTQINGEKKTLQRRNEDGDMENIQTLRVIVLDYTKQRGRSYYDGWDAANPRAPDCWSLDGRRPSVDVAEPKARACDTCQMAAKGSKIVDGKELVACQSHKLLAVVPAQDTNFPAMKLKIGPTSLWDKNDEESMAAGWYAWENYTDLLRANGLDFTGAVVTRMRFAPNVTYQKIQFARGDFLDEDALNVVERLAKSGEVQKLLSGFTPPTTAKKPEGKPLPKEDEDTGPSPEQITADAQSARARLIEAQATADAELAELAAKDAKVKAEAVAVVKRADAAMKKAAKAEADAKAATEKAAAEAAAKAKADEDAGAWDEPAAAPAAKQEVLPPLKAGESAMPARNVTPKATETTAAVVEIPAALSGILGDWGE